VQIITLDRENKEIDAADLSKLVDTYYSNPEDYFHFNGDNIAAVEASASIAVTNNIAYCCQVLHHQSKNIL
jgi:hypothetical protein